MAEPRRVAFAAIGLAALLASCARHEPPAPVVTGTPSPPPVAAPPGPASVSVKRGDSLYLIAKRENVPVRALIDANRLRAPYTLRVGQVLVLPPTRSVAVAATAPAPAPAAAPGPTETTLPPAFPVGRVANAPAPPLAPPPAAPPVATTPEPAPAIAAPEPPAADPAPPPRSGRGFTWPVRGSVVSNFGAKAGGLQNDGINIAAARGTPVRAADAGVVVYAGNELKGFGNLLLLRHADGWMTAYAHLDDIAVERGQSVQRGQVVARVGQSGSVTFPQLHFEVRRGTRPVDPRDHLSPLVSASLR